MRRAGWYKTHEWRGWCHSWPPFRPVSLLAQSPAAFLFRLFLLHLSFWAKLFGHVRLVTACAALSLLFPKLITFGLSVFLGCDAIPTLSRTKGAFALAGPARWNKVIPTISAPSKIRSSQIRCFE